MKLNDIYQRDDFVSFLKEDFLPDFEKDVRDIRQQSNVKTIKDAKFLGESRDLNLQVFEIQTSGKSEKKISQALDSFKLLKEYQSYRSLIAYHSDDDQNWRFALLQMTPDVTEKGKIATNFSNPRRYSFLLGPQAKIKTPEKYLIKDGKVKDFEDLQKRFSVEVVNKDFYREIARFFIRLVGGDTKLGSKTEHFKPELNLPSVDPSDHQTYQEYTVRLIGRIIFCWFLKQKKSDEGVSLLPDEFLSSNAVIKTEDYYHTILEPIFFEVLNKPRESRKPQFRNGYDRIPYLNGGLFDPHYDDFYEGQPSYALKIPNRWFEDLFDVLETYNFTIDENTTLDVDLSIDPEMLGRIFENLLAEINPETGESARKSTGSYYTPRQIVEYMVDQSLIQYLITKTEIDKEKIEALVSVDASDDEAFPLTDEDKKKVVNALDTVKIIDPACGSGAFPIGILQKIVWILGKVDTNGKLWFDKKLEGLDPLLHEDFKQKFENENFDYIRKTGIIRDSIYGVDIQPIAVEVSKLRSFLTLIVDEDIDESLSNRGIKPLPNLEFKFVAANSLISLPESSSKQVGMFEDNSEIEQLKRLRDQYFVCNGFDKERIKSKFKDVQREMFKKQVDKGGHGHLTMALADWDPFKDNSSPWFDAEWMFGVFGFNIVIANPPYLKERDNKEVFEIVNRSDFGKKYHQGKMDFWYYFLHKAIDLVGTDGVISYITSRYWLNSSGSKKLIRRIKKELNFVTFVDIGDIKIFNEVAGQHMVAVYIKSKRIDQFSYKILRNSIEDIGAAETTINSEVKVLSNSNIFINDEIILSNSHYSFEGIVSLGEICEVSQGVVQNPDKVSSKAAESFGLNKGDGVFVLTKSELEKMNLSDQEKTFVKKFYDESDIEPYYLQSSNYKYLLYLTRKNCPDISIYPELKNHLYKFKKIMDKRRETVQGTIEWYQMHWPREPRFFENKKIVFPGMFQSPRAAYVETSAYFGLSSIVIITKDDSYDLKYILAILNSKFASDWFNQYGKRRGVGVDIGVDKLRQFPIRKIGLSEQESFTKEVDKIIALQNSKDYSSVDIKNEIEKISLKLDEMVSDLYNLKIVKG